jgi:glycosyltransferase involved in cell wall biosynthesis
MDIDPARDIRTIRRSSFQCRKGRIRMRSLCVEGWRFITHSYALVNQWQLLSLARRKDLSLAVRDVPFFRPDWKAARRLFDAKSEHRLASIPLCDDSARPDAVLRISYPFDFSVRPNGRTVVFATSELKHVDRSAFVAEGDIENLSDSSTFSVVTPSAWSRQGFLRLGLREDQVVVVPLGVSTDFFHPSKVSRKTIRTKLNLTGFVFANFSAMTWNKGIDILLNAFAVVADRHPDVRLLLKGNDALYTSAGYLDAMIAALPHRVRHSIADRIVYLGGALSIAEMSTLYQAADAYVSPYRAEGFNLPVLEAIACGIPVLCTRGGSTDDFLDQRCALFVEARNLSVRKEWEPTQEYLEPNLDHLVHQMFRAMYDDSWRKAASTWGARHAATTYSWDAIVDRLLVSIFKDRAS